MKKVILEIRASEGGEDSKLLVDVMKDIYVKAAKNNNIN
jgi:protein subunit release factor A